MKYQPTHVRRIAMGHNVYFYHPVHLVGRLNDLTKFKSNGEPERFYVVLVDVNTGELDAVPEDWIGTDWLQPIITHYVLVREGTLMPVVKDAEFFRFQGGLDGDGWGNTWRGVTAASIEDARVIGEDMKAGRVPLTPTVGELKRK